VNKWDKQTYLYNHCDAFLDGDDALQSLTVKFIHRYWPCFHFEVTSFAYFLAL
jgi:hypothetical protein